MIYTDYYDYDEFDKALKDVSVIDKSGIDPFYNLDSNLQNSYYKIDRKGYLYFILSRYTVNLFNLRRAYDYLEKHGRPSLAGQEEVEIICHCLNVTDKDLEEAYKAGDRTWEDLQARTKIGTGCGGCKAKAMEKMHEFEHLYGDN